jgi:hypothetical protein
MLSEAMGSLFVLSLIASTAGRMAPGQSIEILVSKLATVKFR